MTPISRGFGKRRRDDVDPSRLPPGHYYDGGRVSLLEQFMPRFDTRSQHAIEVHAPAQAVFTAVEAVSVKEVRFLRELEFIRALPRLAATGRLDVPTADAPLVFSFTRGAVLLGARPPEEVLVGAIGCFCGVDPVPVLTGSDCSL
jgi:hypothetical protein